jgi:1-acyl-sn-glycerol-3-phosphate acyltransferase
MQTYYPLEETGFHRFVVNTLRALFKTIMTLEISGEGNLPVEGAVIVAGNHVTNLDIFPMQLALNRPIFFMGKAELFKNPIVHFAFRNLGAFPVYRGERDEWAIMHSKRVLSAGQVLGMFPEGTRSRGRGRNRVRIKIGESIWPESGELPIGLTDRVMFQLAKNLPEELRGVYAQSLE